MDLVPSYDDGITSFVSSHTEIHGNRQSAVIPTLLASMSFPISNDTEGQRAYRTVDDEEFINHQIGILDYCISVGKLQAGEDRSTCVKHFASELCLARKSSQQTLHSSKYGQNKIENESESTFTLKETLQETRTEDVESSPERGACGFLTQCRESEGKSDDIYDHFPSNDSVSNISTTEVVMLREELRNRFLRRQEELERFREEQVDIVTISTQSTHGSLEDIKEALQISNTESPIVSPLSDTVLSMQIDPHRRRCAKEGSSVILNRLNRTVRYWRRGNSQPVQPKEYANFVRLHIYDLLPNETIMQLPCGYNFPIGKCFNVINNGLHAIGTGVYHCGIEINGIEYAYGANETAGSTGVFTCVPKHSPGYEYRSTIDLGSRVVRKTQWINVIKGPSNVSKHNSQATLGGSHVYREVEDFLIGRELMKHMAIEYRGTDYDLLQRNCCTFAYDVCIRLGIDKSEIPTWFKNLADAGAQTRLVAQNAMAAFSRTECIRERGNPDQQIQVGGYEVIAQKGHSNRIETVRIIDIEKQAEIETWERSKREVFRTMSWT